MIMPPNKPQMWGAIALLRHRGWSPCGEMGLYCAQLVGASFGPKLPRFLNGGA
jgi:hypothetical protein